MSMQHLICAALGHRVPCGTEYCRVGSIIKSHAAIELWEGLYILSMGSVFSWTLCTSTSHTALKESEDYRSADR